ncbi:MAG: hypothetical protein K0S47_618 [Herbinix sp.]|jgi:poly-gamma-glutamate synthesis protein (capsule biosynthesis protein)|nr:hypothetical protein [Herbinix sp.]
MKKTTVRILSAIGITTLCILVGFTGYTFGKQQKLRQIEDQKDLDLVGVLTPTPVVEVPGEGGGTIEPDITDTVTPTITVTPPVEAGNTSPTPQPGADPDSPTDQPSEPITLTFAGDILFDEGSKPMERYDQKKQGILGGLSADLVEEMKAANIMMLNNEFPYSTRGTKTLDKTYTFRANPSRVDILHEMGVDIVSLANNHALDYGKDALMDTFDTLEDAKVEYVGAGRDLDRAKAPIYMTIGATKIAYLAASRVIFAGDWYATTTEPGMFGTYDPTMLIEQIKEAEKNSDFVVVFLHWGVESNQYPEEYQKIFAKQYIDAGADAVIGCHPHVMQGFEYYKGKPIAYSLGNFWFSSYRRESGLFKLTLETDGTVKAQIFPVMTDNCYTYLLEADSEKKNYFDYMEDISFGVTIDEEGFITESE